MQRLTKAALATGAAEVLLMGGAGTMAYWTGQGTVNNPTALSAGTFSVDETQSNCGPWKDANGVNVALVVPGDTVNITCNFTLNVTGDHVALGGAQVSTLAWQTGSVLAPVLLSPTVTGIQVVTTGGAGQSVVPDSSTGLISPALDVHTGATVNVTVSVQFPYGNASNNTTQGSTAQLSAITVTLIQGNTTMSTPAPSTPAP